VQEEERKRRKRNEPKEWKRRRMKVKRNQISSERWREHKRVGRKQNCGRIKSERGREDWSEKNWKGMMQLDLEMVQKTQKKSIQKICSRSMKIYLIYCSLFFSSFFGPHVLHIPSQRKGVHV
jgi:hypothetical protein